MTDRLAASAAHAALEHVGENAERVLHPPLHAGKYPTPDR
jgi:hypothetical protein